MNMNGYLTLAQMAALRANALSEIGARSVKQKEQEQPPKNAKRIPRGERRNQAKRITKANYLRG